MKKKSSDGGHGGNSKRPPVKPSEQKKKEQKQDPKVKLEIPLNPITEEENTTEAGTPKGGKIIHA